MATVEPSSPVRLTFSVDGKKQFDHTMLGIYNSAQNFTEPFNKIANSFRTFEDKVFRAEGGHEGLTPWKKPLSKGYLAWKTKYFPHQKILRLRDYLIQSLTKKDYPNHICRITPSSLEIGTSVPYAMKHQKGEGVPARPPVRLSDEEKKRWIRIFRDEIKRRIDRSVAVPYYAG